MPLISICMAAFNAQRTIAETIDSILAQTFLDFELVVIDDASVDKTAEIIKSYADARIVYVRNENNLGITKSLNHAVALAKGEFITRMDADDVMTPNRLERQLQIMQENPDIGILGSYAQNLTPDGKAKGLNKKPLTHNEIKAQSFFTCPMIHPSVMMRRNVLPENGPLYDESFPRAQDMELWSRLVHQTRFANIAEPLIGYRHQVKSAQKSMKADLKALRSRIAERNLNYLIEHPSLTDSSGMKALLGIVKTDAATVKAIAEKLRAANRLQNIYPRIEFEQELEKHLRKNIKTKWYERKFLKLFLLVMALVFLVYGAHEIWANRQETKNRQLADQLAQKIAGLCLQSQHPRNKLQEIEILRGCIHANTIHLTTDPEFKAKWRYPEKMTQSVLDYMQGKRSDKPAFECSTRSMVLGKVLKARGFKTQSITVVQNLPKFPDHVVVEVVNPDTGEKILQDASFDVSFWLNSRKKQPANAEAFLDLKNLVPCRGDKCSWDLSRTDIGQVKNWRKFAASYRRENDKKKSVLFYDPQRFDVKAYCAKKAKWCRNLRSVP